MTRELASEEADLTMEKKLVRILVTSRERLKRPAMLAERLRGSIGYWATGAVHEDFCSCMYRMYRQFLLECLWLRF